MFNKVLAILALAVASVLGAQQPQTVDIGPSINPIFSANARYTNGVAPGYWPTNPSGTGLVLNVSAGTSFFAGTLHQDIAQTIALTDASTNYVYLDMTSGSLAFNTTGFVSGQFPIAVVTTSGGRIVSNGITDVRTLFNDLGSGGGSGPCIIFNVDSTICGTGNNVTPGAASQEYGFENNNTTAFGSIRNLVSIGNNNTLNSTGSDVINIGDTVGQADSSSPPSLSQVDTIIMGDNSGQTAHNLGDVIALGDFELSGVSGDVTIEDVVAIGNQGAENLNDGTNILVCIGFAPCQNTGVAGAATESIFIGDSAGQDSVGTENIGLGDGALRNLHGSPPGNTGNANFAGGLLSLASNSSGIENVAIGSNSGCVGCTNSSNGTNGNVTGSHNVWIGDTTGQSVASTTEIDYSIAIGYKAQNDQTNETVIGSSPAAGAGATALAIIWGNVEINGGTNVVFRCTTAGSLAIGALTTNSADCTASTDTGLRVQ